jgi:hypothetical protein
MLLQVVAILDDRRQARTVFVKEDALALKHAVDPETIEP